MKKLLYYPSFEVQNYNWLKFALLYIDELRPIIPTEGDRYLSGEYSKIISDTDLINQYRPNYEDGTRATLDAIDVIENILREPNRYSNLLGGQHFVEEWKDTGSHKYIIFEQKYTDQWKEFCIRERLGKPKGEGVIVAKSLGLLYMTLLTNVISEKMRLSTITDYQNLDNISILARRQIPTDNTINVAKGIISLKLPKNLENMSFGKIIEYRNRRDFKKCLHAFHADLEKYLKDLEDGKAEKGFLDMGYEGVSEYYLDMALLGVEMEAFAFSSWMAITSPENYAALTSTVLTGTTLLINSIYTINKLWRHTEGTRMQRKYLTELSKIQ